MLIFLQCIGYLVLAMLFIGILDVVFVTRPAAVNKDDPTLNGLAAILNKPKSRKPKSRNTTS